MEKNREKSNSFKAGMSSRDHHQQQQVMMMKSRSPPVVGLSWPPTSCRSYTCSFCKREFRSAQALGGHMNVHRRDRARVLITHSSPPHHNSITTLKQPYNILPNLNMPPPIISSLTTDHDKPSSPSPFAAAVIPYSSCFISASPPSCSSSSSSSSSASFLFGVREWRNFMEAGGRKDDQAAMMIKHGLDDDDSVCADHVDGSLDLELRLGYT